MELKIRYRKAQCEDSIPMLFIDEINARRDSSSRVLNLSFLDNFFRENEKELENCDVRIGMKVELNEELFNFITTKFYDIARKCNMELTTMSLLSRIHCAYEFVEKCKNYGIKFKHYHLHHVDGYITL